jgi:hypothetical protein
MNYGSVQSARVAAVSSFAACQPGSCHHPPESEHCKPTGLSRTTAVLARARTLRAQAQTFHAISACKREKKVFQATAAWLLTSLNHTDKRSAAAVTVMVLHIAHENPPMLPAIAHTPASYGLLRRVHSPVPKDPRQYDRNMALSGHRINALHNQAKCTLLGAAPLKASLCTGTGTGEFLHLHFDKSMCVNKQHHFHNMGKLYIQESKTLHTNFTPHFSNLFCKLQPRHPEPSCRIAHSSTWIAPPTTSAASPTRMHDTISAAKNAHPPYRILHTRKIFSRSCSRR